MSSYSGRLSKLFIFQEFAESKVNNFDLELCLLRGFYAQYFAARTGLFGEDNIFQFEIPMDDVLGVHVPYCAENFPHDYFDCILAIKDSISDQAIEDASALAQLLDYIKAFFVEVDFEELNDVGVVQFLQDLHLLKQLLFHYCVHLSPADYLYRSELPRSLAHRSVNISEASLSNLLQKFIVQVNVGFFQFYKILFLNRHLLIKDFFRTHKLIEILGNIFDAKLNGFLLIHLAEYILVQEEAVHAIELLIEIMLSSLT